MGRAIKQDDSKMGRAIKQKFEWGGPQNKNPSGEGRKAKFRARRTIKTPFFALRVPTPIPRPELNQETGHYKTYSEMSSQTKKNNEFQTRKQYRILFVSGKISMTKKT